MASRAYNSVNDSYCTAMRMTLDDRRWKLAWCWDDISGTRDVPGSDFDLANAKTTCRQLEALSWAICVYAAAAALTLAILEVNEGSDLISVAAAADDD